MERKKVLEMYDKYKDENEDYSNESKILYLKFLLSLNTNIYDIYLELMNIYFQEENFKDGSIIIEKAYKKILNDEFNNVLPLTLNYQELYNRSIFRVFYNYADILWILDKKNEAISLFKKLIEMHPNDNIGARYAICGILEGYASSNHIWNEYNQNIDNWFRENIVKYTKKEEYVFLQEYVNANAYEFFKS